MQYHVSRDGQVYGPYTLEDLQRFVTSGNVLLTDMARSDASPEWIPVSQVLGAAQTAVSPLAPPVGTPATIYPDAPNLNWGLVLLFSFFTCTLFMYVWNLVLASWMKRVKPNSTAVFYYGVAAVLALISAFVGRHAEIHVQTGTMMHWNYFTTNPLRGVVGLASWVVRLIARYTMRADLEEHFNGPEPVGLSLSGVMTFFFGGLYFQYHLNRINELKRIARYRGAAI